MADIYLISHQYVEYLKNKYHTYQAPDICKIDRFLTSDIYLACGVTINFEASDIYTYDI